MVNNGICTTLDALTIAWADHASWYPDGKEVEWAVVATNNNDNTLDSDDGMGRLLDGEVDKNKYSG